MEEKLKIRKHLVFLLNTALDLQKKFFVSPDDMVLFSSEVKYFLTLVDKSDLNTELKNKLKSIKFNYSPNRAEFSSFAVLAILTIFTFGLFLIFYKIQELDRKRKLVSFLNNYENLLKAFSEKYS